MNPRNLANAAVLLGVAGAMVAAVAASVRHGASAAVERERCYGIAKAGQNDCANAVHSCAKSGATDADATEWIAVPKGTCLRLAGGRLDESVP